MSQQLASRSQRLPRATGCRTVNHGILVATVQAYAEAYSDVPHWSWVTERTGGELLDEIVDAGCLSADAAVSLWDELARNALYGSPL